MPKHAHAESDVVARPYGSTTKDLAMICSDFTRYLHLHRVRTVLQLITPDQDAGCPGWDRKTLQEYRDVPGAAFKGAHERQDGGGCLPMAIDDARFERMTDEQMDHVDADVKLCLGRYYGQSLGTGPDRPD